MMVDKLNYVDKLKKLDEVLEIYFNDKPNYLRGKCDIVATFASIVIPELSIKAGFCNYEFHVWNYDFGKDLIVDLTAWQFENFLMPKDKIVFNSNSETHVNSIFYTNYVLDYRRLGHYDQVIEDLKFLYNNL